MVPGSVITVVSRPPTASSRPLDELLGLAGWQLHGVHEGRHDGLVLGGAGRLGRSSRRLRLVGLRRKERLPAVCLCLEATRSGCPALTPPTKCLRPEVGAGPVCGVLTVGGGQVGAVCHGVPGSLAPYRGIPGQARELLAEQWRLLVQEILLPGLVWRGGARACH